MMTVTEYIGGSDPVHLAKKMRNCLYSSRLAEGSVRTMRMRGHPAVWDHILAAARQSQGSVIAVLRPQAGILASSVLTPEWLA